MLPSGPHVTSVGRLYVPRSARGRSPLGSVTPRSMCSSHQSIDSGLRPSTMETRPVGSTLMTMFEPSSTTHTLSFESTRNPCANDRPYAFGIHSFTYLLFLSNSNTRAALPPRELPLHPVREKTNRWPAEFSDTPSVSPIVSLGIRSGRIVSVTCT